MSALAPACAGYFPQLGIATYPAPKFLPAPYRPENEPAAKRPPGRPPRQCSSRVPGAPRAVLPFTELHAIAEKHGATLERAMARTWWKTDKPAWKARNEMWAHLIDVHGWSLQNIGLAFGGRHHATIHTGAKVHRQEASKVAA